MPNHVYIATSLDGFIATQDGGIEWLEDVPNPTGSDFGFADFLSRVDAVVMGRVTFEKVLTFGTWPYPLPVIVLSRTLTTVPPHLVGKVQLLGGPLADVLAQLEAQGLQRLYIDGGQVIQAFLREDRIDELTLTRFPKLLGTGLPLFGDLPQPLDFVHVETEVLANQLVKSRYRRVR